MAGPPLISTLQAPASDQRRLGHLFGGEGAKLPLAPGDGLGYGRGEVSTWARRHLSLRPRPSTSEATATKARRQSRQAPVASQA
jgi:hypothetical protein